MTFNDELVKMPRKVLEYFEREASDTVDGPRLTADGLKRILVDLQKAPDHIDAGAIIRKIVARPRGHGTGSAEGLTCEQFLKYLHDVQNTPPCMDKVIHDMTAPLNHYYIMTGHNSYLTGNQLSSKCSPEPIIKALRDGVRVIELDLWEAGGEIVVLHGRTLTPSATFEECLWAIKEHAFVASPYPVIVTLEDHMPQSLHGKAAELLKKVFGEQLFIPDSTDAPEFPSPQSLKYRIIISTMPPEVKTMPSQRMNSNSELRQKSTGARKKHVSKIRMIMLSVQKKKTKKEEDVDDDQWGLEPEDIVNHDEPESDSDESAESDSETQLQMTLNGDTMEYRSLILIHAGKPKSSLRQGLLIKEKKAKRLSLSEVQLERAAKKYPKELVRFTQLNMLRIYPKGSRVTSTNYNPMTAWAHGAQMAAINMQKKGRMLWLVHGFFKANGGVGYVKKPDYLLPSKRMPECDLDKESEELEGLRLPPRRDSENLWPIKMTLKVTILLGRGWLESLGKHYFDRWSAPDFYVKVYALVEMKYDSLSFGDSEALRHYVRDSQTAAMDQKAGEADEAYEARLAAILADTKQRADAAAAARKKKEAEAERLRLLAEEQRQKHEAAAARAADEERVRRREVIFREESALHAQAKDWQKEAENGDPVDVGSRVSQLLNRVTDLLATCIAQQEDIYSLDHTNKALQQSLDQTRKRVQQLEQRVANANANVGPSDLVDRVNILEIDVGTLKAGAQQHVCAAASSSTAPRETIVKFDGLPIFFTELHKYITWTDLTAAWKKRFQAEPPEHKAMDKLLTFSQNSMPSGDWISEFQRLASTPKLPLNFDGIKLYFIKRSCPALQNALTHVADTLTTSEELFNKAAQIIVTNLAARNTSSSSNAGQGAHQHRPKVAAVAAATTSDPSTSNEAVSSDEGDRLAAAQLVAAPPKDEDVASRRPTPIVLLGPGKQLQFTWTAADHTVNFHQRILTVRDGFGAEVPCTIPPPHPSIRCQVVTAKSFRATCAYERTEEIGLCFLRTVAVADSQPTDLSLDPRVVRLLDEFADVFESPTGVVPDRPISHEVILEAGAVPPKGCIYRMSEEELTVLRAQLDDLLDKGWIRPSSSPYGAPVLFVRKKNKDLRLCIDYRKLNAQNVKNAGPLPRIDDLLERLGGADFFSKLDLKSGYHQISIRPQDHYKTVFKTRYGHFEWVVMPFGLTNAPATFQTAMTSEFYTMLDRFVLVYLDDILVYSRTLEEHLDHLRQVLETLRRAKFKANRDKCKFVRQALEYLGHFVTPQGISPLSDKIQAVQDWPKPRNVTDVRSFLKTYSKIAAHLTKLQCEDRPFDFRTDARESFLALKAALLSAEVLQIYDPLLPTRVTKDASGYGIGAVLEHMTAWIGTREAIAMDITGPFPKHKTGVDGILTVVDRLTKFAMFLPCRYHAKAPELAEVLYVGWIRTKGYPKEIVCDRDTRFMSDFWLALIKRWGSSLKLSSARHPQTDGQTERAHQTAQVLLRTLIRPDQKDWVERLPDVELAYNSSIHPAIGMSPFEFEHGLPVNSPLDTIMPRMTEGDNHLLFIRRMQELLVKACDQMSKTQQRMRQQANRQRLPCPFRAGDLVRVSGVDGDSKNYTLKQLEDDFYPSWEDELCEFPLRVPELAVLRIEVHEYDKMGKDDFGGQTVLPVSALLPGFRSMPLYDRGMHILGSVSLLTLIEIEEHHPVQADDSVCVRGPFPWYLVPALPDQLMLPTIVTWAYQRENAGGSRQECYSCLQRFVSLRATEHSARSSTPVKALNNRDLGVPEGKCWQQPARLCLRRFVSRSAREHSTLASENGGGAGADRAGPTMLQSGLRWVGPASPSPGRVNPVESESGRLGRILIKKL
ncbi:hypothetical protein CBR_g36522 [Chara braunii]|uniref:Phosphoinositide phospholipase C n=1 Tax=Chara braunii TaxID=69332 RepID=A0A388LL80_CHABU|nr:hypothetical protein CBR_g36522 [Chara braunii]|eukprot:GBG82993.1 hypothetical protein CBR_g36522 [Chara braunii]